MSQIESPEFGRMLEAFSAARAMRPTMTLNSLRGTMVICGHDGEMTYAEFAERSRFSEKPRLNYMMGASLIAQLCDGRGRYPGLRLCERLPGADRRQKVVVAGADGATMALNFLRAAGQRGAASGREWINNVLIPAIDEVMDRDAGLALSTFCVLLDIAHNASHFEGGGAYSNSIAKRLGVNNLPNHMARLAGLPRGNAGAIAHPALITMHDAPHDRRGRWPVLNERGREMLTAFSNILIGEPEPVSV